MKRHADIHAHRGPCGRAAGRGARWPATPAPDASTIAVRLADARAAQRDLWIGHVFWVRNVVDATFEGDAAAAKAAEATGRRERQGDRRLDRAVLRQGRLGEAVHAARRPLGRDQGLSRRHPCRRRRRADAAFKDLLKNADEIAAFLGGANPNLPVDALKGLLAAHGSHHVQQIKEFEAKQFDAEAKTWAAMTGHMYVIADALADGIAKQFPDKFR